jgi:hypothetical protein
MRFLNLAICHTAAMDSERRTRASREADGVMSLRFGDKSVFLGAEQGWRSFSESAERSGALIRELPAAVDSGRLYVVIQKGRLFQHHHPEIPVLLDKGRFLLVDIPPEKMKELQDPELPCYTVRPLQSFEPTGPGGSRSVFDLQVRGEGHFRSRTPDPAILAAVERISKDGFGEALTGLVQLPTRLSTSPHYDSACDLAEQQLAAAGYQTSRQTFAIGAHGESRNVIARQSGSRADAGLVLVTAHLDSVNHGGGAGAPAPGADDDGSGSAGVLEMARALRLHPAAHDLCFVLFGGEEQGLFGSKHFVRSLPDADRSRVRAVVTMDMIGRLNIAAPTVLIEGAAASQATIDGLAAAAATYTNLGVETSTNAANSDHVSFLRAGIPAVLTIEGADSSNGDVHTERDTLDTIDLDLAVAILKMNTAYVAEQLGRGITP